MEVGAEEGELRLDRWFRRHFPGLGHGKLDLSEGLVQSCDIVFYELGNKLESIDSNILADYAHQFGLGEPTGIQGLVEAGGIVPNPDWKKKNLKDPVIAEIAGIPA